MQPNYIERMKDKRSAASLSVKEAAEQAAMLAEMKKMQMMTALAAGNNKPTVILTDQTDLGDKMKDLADVIEQSILSTDTTDVNAKQLTELKNIVVAIRSMPTPHFDTSAIVAAIKAQNLSTVVNVPDLPAPQVDLSSIENTMRELWERPDVLETESHEEVDLDCYRAQDLTDGDDVQYVGFVNPDGKWYIIENKIKENTMRYVFGSSGYASAFKRAATFEYNLLNEAIHATS